LVNKAIDIALERIDQYPVVTIVINKSHHIGCLAAYPERATQQNLMMLLSCSDPRNHTVAPFGGLGGVYSPNPIAVGIPTQTDPIIFDISTSTTASGNVNRALQEGKELPHPWLLDANGNPTANPREFNSEPPATILPLGGMDSGYKGFALGIMIEALTNALGGFGRYTETTRWGASVFIQLINPSFFSGNEAFQQEMQFFADSCLGSKPAPGVSQVRLPGSRALALRAKQKQNGLNLYPGVIENLEPWAVKYAIAVPVSLN